MVEAPPEPTATELEFEATIATARSNQPEGVKELDTRPYQKRCVTRTVDYFRLKRTADTISSSVMIESATGSGKTVMALTAAKLMQESHDVVWGFSAMRKNLLHQSAQMNRDLGINVEHLVPISMFDNNPPTHAPNGKRITGLIVDECQHDAAASMMHLHSEIRPYYILGLSATPFRADKQKLCFERVIKDAGMAQLMDQGYLSRFHKYSIPEWKPEVVAERYLAEPARWGQSAFYWRTMQEAVRCYDLLQMAGVRVGLIHGAMRQADRETMLDQFEDGTLTCLVNLYVLTEGWDCPSLQTVWVRDSVKGPTMQMAGRAFRIHEGTPIKQVIQSQKTRFPIERVVKPSGTFRWEGDDWTALGNSDVADKVACAMLIGLSKVDVPPLPSFILKNRKKNRFSSDPDPDGLGVRPDAPPQNPQGGMGGHRFYIH